MSRQLLRRLAAVAGAAATALLLAAAPASAQPGRAPEARLVGRLDAATLRQVMAQVDSARQDGLPFEKLVDRALEGASKRAPGPRIVAEVRRLHRALGEARLALGRSASPVEIEAGASALQASVQPRVLASLRQARAEGSLTVPLAVLTDLVAYGVPVDTAARTVLALASAEDAALVAYQRDVERDISVGALPAAAASLRAGVIERSLNAVLRSGSAAPAVSGMNSGNLPANRPPLLRKP